ncbi:MAG: hypothetical protein COV59_02500 [Candidatus Magasanikbacteria bacterium CG11_big_fil_rev_8_21_14_0_20_39_34]|uniref:UDP-N-acetylglucosamine--N-acetylmuramyl-(pentapeptide) pyrophosphoryl-undecaprenol N-acetylglucosamine transferase n=1 Tax=Candidatus Magasanikbacteria bacterium CG11_big_fil_rev_8_21_14_0_20_39_34 TaxID=1974653 RepID=A0A2H0N561_9BACT|nr:MAG: hypothetical protein COV59_02500 [Candidatus Magasanikbacteria bacterium CG11_big_fil_rev_8_21_14_0_20_39_34]
MKILLSGGGTLGPVTPLLAIADIVLEHTPDAQFVFVGTKGGPERDIVQEKGIPFYSITSGKLRRYFSLLNFIDLFKFLKGFLDSIKIIWLEKPDLCISAGGYNSVPLHIVSWFFGIPTWIHQQDLRVGLSNKIMAPFSKCITVALQENVKKFSNRKTILLGNPVRQDILNGDKSLARKRFGLKNNMPVVFCMGGGTGSQRINEIILQALPHLQDSVQIVHVVGKDRGVQIAKKASTIYKNYHPYALFTSEMKDAYAVSDIIISRGGFGSLTEIAAVKKPAIIIPKSGHQVENVAFLAERKAVLLCNEDALDGNILSGRIKNLLLSPDEGKRMVENLEKNFRIANTFEVELIVNRLTR